MKKQRNMFQREKQDKTSERDLNETAVSDLTDKRIQNNGHKDAHQDWEKYKQSENFSKALEDKRKCQIKVTELKNAITE